MNLRFLILALVVVLGFSCNAVQCRIFDEGAEENSLVNQDLEKVISQRPIHHESVSKKRNEPSEGDQESENDLSDHEAESGVTGYVIRMLSKAFRFLNMRKLIKNVQNGRSTPGACMTCKFAMNMVRYMLDFGNGFKDISYVTRYFCKSLNVQTPRVCDGYVKSFLEEFVVAMSKTESSPSDICGTLLGESCHIVEDPLHNWTLPLPPSLRMGRLQRPFNNLWSSFGHKAQKHFKVLQISDIHIDPEYAEGTNAVCQEPLCCRPSSPGSQKQVSPDRRAGYWGDYRDCDIPLRTVEETFRFIRENHPDIDYIIWTGDIPPHDIWNQTRESQLELINVVGNLFDQYFGHIPIYPVVGNHESLPMNSFPIPTANIDKKYMKDWLYDKLSESWLRWLPLETQATVEKGAFFAVRAKSGLKVISLNTNFCSNQNWWILLNSTDPGNQLEWLINQLTDSEQLGEMVQIIGHIPPGSNDCIQMWSRNYNRIINRFAHIVKGQFFGHTHNDEFEIFYEDMTPHSDPTYAYDKTYRATNVAYIGPSITTFGNVNPGYRIYTIDAHTFDIVDHQTHFLNLTAANAHRNSRQVQFEKSYSAKEAYGLKNLSAHEWHRLVMRMKTPTRSEDAAKKGKVKEADELFRQFYRFFYNRSDNIGDDNECEDESCKYETLCRLLTAYSHDSAICRHFLL